MSCVDDIGKQVRELLPEYPHLWSRVIAMVERLEQENAVLREALEFYKSRTSYAHLIPGGDNTTWIEHDGGHKAREALEKARVLREGK